MNSFRRRLHAMTAIAAMCLFLPACSEMRFVNSQESGDHDPREDLCFTSVRADLTSGGLVLHRIGSERASYSEVRGLLDLERLTVNTFDDDSTGVKGVTRARAARIFLADNAAEKRRRNDMHFTGDVNYSIPAKDDPTTDMVQLSTPDLLWDATAKRFTGKSEISISMRQKDGKTMALNGAAFSVSSDMRKWAIGSALMSSDPMEVAAPRVAAIRQQLAAAAGQQSPEPTPPPKIELPDQMVSGTVHQATPTSISVPRMPGVPSI